MTHLLDSHQLSSAGTFLSGQEPLEKLSVSREQDPNHVVVTDISYSEDCRCETLACKKVCHLGLLVTATPLGQITCGD